MSEDTTVDVGVATTSRLLKKRWHAEFGKGTAVLSLKQFARKLAASGDKMAKDWFAHKKGSLNQARSDANKTRATLERKATRDAKRNKAKKNAAKTTAVVAT